MKDIIERAGGKFIGTGMGRAWFNDPKTGSTLTVKNGATIADVRKSLYASRAAFNQSKGRGSWFRGMLAEWKRTFGFMACMMILAGCFVVVAA